MSSLEFALSLIVTLMAFLAFAMTIATILLGSKKTKVEAKKLFHALIKSFLPYSSSRRTTDSVLNLQDQPKAVKQEGRSKV